MRQTRVHRDYHNAARSTDRKFNNTPEDAIGPVEARLSSFGIIQGLVVGAFAEGSSHLHHLIDQYANTAANRLWRGMGARNAMEARNILRQDARRHLGVEMARGNAATPDTRWTAYQNAKATLNKATQITSAAGSEPDPDKTPTPPPTTRGPAQNRISP